MILESEHRRRPWDRMMLVQDYEGFRLQDELSETLATASDLPALFDAVDGGVAESRTTTAGVPRMEMMAGLVI